MHDLEDCWCPLSSIHCKRQSEIRWHWFTEVKEGQVDLVKQLCEDAESSKEFLSVKNDEGRTALHVAVSSGDTDMVAVLLEKMKEFVPGGKLVDAQCPQGMTALMTACQDGSGPLLSLLMKHGASLAVRSAKGKTARMLAEAAGHAELTQLLESKFSNKALIPASQDAPPNVTSAEAKAGDGNVDLWGSDGEMSADGEVDEAPSDDEGEVEPPDLAGRRGLISKHPLFQSTVSAANLEQLVQSCSERTLDQGGVVSYEEPKRHGMTWVMAGSMKVEEHGGEERVAATGDGVGNLALLAGEKLRITLTAIQVYPTPYTLHPEP